MTIRRTITIPRSDLFIFGFISVSTLSWYSFAYGTSQQQECIVYCCNTGQNLEKGTSIPWKFCQIYIIQFHIILSKNLYILYWNFIKIVQVCCVVFLLNL